MKGKIKLSVLAISMLAVLLAVTPRAAVAGDGEWCAWNCSDTNFLCTDDVCLANCCESSFYCDQVYSWCVADYVEENCDPALEECTSAYCENHCDSVYGPTVDECMTALHGANWQTYCGLFDCSSEISNCEAEYQSGHTECLEDCNGDPFNNGSNCGNEWQACGYDAEDECENDRAQCLNECWDEGEAWAYANTTCGTFTQPWCSYCF